MWDKNRLHVLAEQRRSAMADVGEALLAFVRANEMTDEGYIEQRQAEYDLERALDKLTPEAGTKLQGLGNVARDEVLRDFLMKVTDHTQQRIEKDMAEVEALQRDDRARDDEEQDDDEPGRRRGRGR